MPPGRVELLEGLRPTSNPWPSGPRQGRGGDKLTSQSGPSCKTWPLRWWSRRCRSGSGAPERVTSCRASCGPFHMAKLLVVSLQRDMRDNRNKCPANVPRKRGRDRDGRDMCLKTCPGCPAAPSPQLSPAFVPNVPLDGNHSLNACYDDGNHRNLLSSSARAMTSFASRAALTARPNALRWRSASALGGSSGSACSAMRA
jgi:hypothetical protein